MIERKPLYQAIATAVDARLNCQATGNDEWYDRWTERLTTMAKKLPSGSGLDIGPKIDLVRSQPNRIVIADCDYHHLNEHGCYVRWTEHEVIITPCLAHGFRLRVTGRNRNDVKEVIHSAFMWALMEEVET